MSRCRNRPGRAALLMPYSRTMRVARSVAPVQVARRARRRLAEHEQLGGAAAQPHGERVLEVALAVEVAFVDRELLGDAQCLPGGQDRHLGDRVGVRRQRRNQRVPGLVHGDRVLLLGHQRVRRLAAPEQDAVARLGEVRRGDGVASVAHCDDRGLVDQVREVRAREARVSTARRRRGRRRRPKCLSRACTARIAARSRAVRQRDLDLPVEAARAAAARGRGSRAGSSPRSRRRPPSGRSRPSRRAAGSASARARRSTRTRRRGAGRSRRSRR